MHLPRLMIAGTHSGVGKTTIATGIMALLSREGYQVQPYKVGPDYIDPTYHTVATGNKSRNMDTWMLGADAVQELFYRSAQKREISVIEGVMGLYDGYGGNDETGSSAHVAKILKAPVILIIDVKSMARSAAAIAMGFCRLDPEVPIAGVILNRIGSEKHYQIVKTAIEENCSIPVVGYVPRNANIELPERHLGLVPTGEGSHLTDRLDEIAVTLSKGIDIKKIIEIAQGAPPLEEPEQKIFPGEEYPKVRIALAKDEAFSFYYQDSIDLWEAYGAEFVEFSPLKDQKLPPDIKGIYIGGGFPEMYIYQLAENKTMMQEIRAAALAGMPVYAECGGLMYLTRAIVGFTGQEYPLVGLVPAKCIMEKKLVGMGYVVAKALQDSVIALAGQEFRGHEFHYSRLLPEEENYSWAYQLAKSMNSSTFAEGYASGNILTSYVHVHMANQPQLAARFLENCRHFKGDTNGE